MRVAISIDTVHGYLRGHVYRHVYRHVHRAMLFLPLGLLSLRSPVSLVLAEHIGLVLANHIGVALDPPLRVGLGREDGVAPCRSTS